MYSIITFHKILKLFIERGNEKSKAHYLPNNFKWQGALSYDEDVKRRRKTGDFYSFKQISILIYFHLLIVHR